MAEHYDVLIRAARVCDGSGKLAKPKQLLWVMVSAGWCGPCIQEIRELGKIIDSGGIDERVAFVDILFENDDHKPATEDFAKKWADTLGLKFPLLLDPTFQMGAYFDRQAVPFNMLVDLDTMQVYFSITGAAFATLGQQVVLRVTLGLLRPLGGGLRPGLRLKTQLRTADRAQRKGTEAFQLAAGSDLLQIQRLLRG